ncbi:MAG: hypothetical protein F4012_11540, partial [Gemmatimonadales bacterium]|nr:hypothetical protein [Gemmatimonadales bacterium]
MNRIPRLFASLLALSLFVPFAGPGHSSPLAAQEVAPGAVTLDSAFLAGYRWRNLGPDRGGRSIATSGVVGRPLEGYFGATGGG